VPSSCTALCCTSEMLVKRETTSRAKFTTSSAREHDDWSHRDTSVACRACSVDAIEHAGAARHTRVPNLPDPHYRPRRIGGSFAPPSGIVRRTSMRPRPTILHLIGIAVATSVTAGIAAADQQPSEMAGQKTSASMTVQKTDPKKREMTVKDE